MNEKNEDYIYDELLNELRREISDEELNSIFNRKKLEKEKMLQEDLHKFYAHVHLCEKCRRHFGIDDTVIIPNKRYLCPICDPPGRKDFGGILKRNSVDYYTGMT